MYGKLVIVFLFTFFSFTGFANTRFDYSKASHPDNDTLSRLIKRDTATWFDSARKRWVPIAIYFSQSLSDSINRTKIKQKIVILNPGYPGKSTDYQYIARNLAAHGYYVVTIQHDLPSDPPIPTQGNLYDLRLPFWNTGVENILFTLGKLKTLKPELDYKNLILIGHSNGGDIAMLLARRYAKTASVIISLDNRRVPFPRAKHPKIFSLRSSDQPADPGILPTPAEQGKYQIKLVKVNIVHDDMGGFGTINQLTEINNYILDFLENKS